ncbi:cytochrome P450 [Favolaschia claudopus]|uniref:Cytochrome P450 n=1 Tax=Favolaschia claudopus TaxID=2862362 RepID=A0AAV9ZQJ4_9AGAR
MPLTEQFDEIASHSVGDISPLLGQATLASVAEAILGLSLNELGDEFISTNLQLINVASNQSATQVLADALLRWIPNAICDLMLYIPVQPFSFVSRAKVLTDEIGKRVIRSSKIAKSKGLEGIGGFYDALVDKAQTYSSDGNNAFSERDILDQTTLLLLAGQDTTANTLVFGFLELARDVDLQERLRAEIHFYYASRLGTRDANTFDNMPLLNAFIKETLRLYPAVALSDRVATEDVVLPLSEPIITSRGKQLTQIPIPKGQIVYIGTAEYQRSESIWGPDAHEFKTSRWLKDDGPLKGEGVSSYANLLSFFGGTRICLGWRFALLEMQIFVCELVTKFEFSLPDEVHLRTTCQYAMTLQPMLPDGKKGAFLAIKRVT